LNSEASQIRAAVPINKGGCFFRFETACLEKNAAMTTMTCSIACLPARAFPRFQWRGGTAPHARSEITLGSNAHGATPAVMKGARKRNARGPGTWRKGRGDTAAKDALVAVAALSLAPLSTQVHRLITSSDKERETATTGRCCYSISIPVSSDPLSCGFNTAAVTTKPGAVQLIESTADVNN
jgi:hypothetical protein